MWRALKISQSSFVIQQTANPTWGLLSLPSVSSPDQWNHTFKKIGWRLIDFLKHPYWQLLPKETLYQGWLDWYQDKMLMSAMLSNYQLVWWLKTFCQAFLVFIFLMGDLPEIKFSFAVSWRKKEWKKDLLAVIYFVVLASFHWIDPRTIQSSSCNVCVSVCLSHCAKLPITSKRLQF